MTPWLDDGDVRLYHGDVLDVLAELPDQSVDCVVTSPPYWGLRDYDTGQWDGGNPDCDHLVPGGGSKRGLNSDGHNIKYETSVKAQAISCRKCGARRVDQQLGLEPTPDLFVTNMVAVFREIRRVLADHGTCWVNLGDSYAANVGGKPDGSNTKGKVAGHVPNAWGGGTQTPVKRPPCLKPKDLVGVPWRVAFALQADGWWLRSDIIWAKPNPMPESVTDRPTKAHEYVFLLTKQPRYWFDTEAVREKADYSDWRSQFPNANKRTAGPKGYDESRNDYESISNSRWEFGAGRNVRSVWQIATQPYPEAHFATFPEELARRCILAGCPTRVCRVCGKPSERIVEKELRGGHTVPNARPFVRAAGRETVGGSYEGGETHVSGHYEVTTVGWSDCDCAKTHAWTHVIDCPQRFGNGNGCTCAKRWRRGVVLDPFIGSGTVAKVARDHGRHAIGIDLNSDYLELAGRRLQQLSLLT